MVDVWAGSETTFAGSSELLAGRTNPPHKGVRFLLLQDGVLVAGCQSNGITITGEAVDVTTKDNLTSRTLLPYAGTSSVSLSASGIFEDLQVMDDIRAAVGTKTLLPFTVEYEYDGTIDGEFQVVSYEQSGEHNGATQFTIGLESSGPVTIIG